MANTVLLSAMTMIALTGVALTSLKYRHDNDHSDVVVSLDDDNSTETIDAARVNPKFHFYDVLAANRTTEKIVAKRSTFDPDQYAIDDKNVSMVDGDRREKVKQVQAGHGLMMEKNFRFAFHFTICFVSPWN